MRPVYRTACVSYLDILGFKAVVNDVYRNNPEVVKTILDYFVESQNIVDFSTQTKKLTSHKPTEVFHFSDCLVRIVELPTGSPPMHSQSKRALVNTHKISSIVCHEISSLAKVQRILATRGPEKEDTDYPGIFIRGGLTLSEIYYSKEESQVFGPALNRVVELEDHAGAPRIVIDPLCMQNYESVFSDATKNGLIRCGEENVYHIDYFTPESNKIKKDPRRHLSKTPSKSDLEDVDNALTRMIAVEQLQLMRAVLIKRIKTHARNERALNKYFWAAGRHNDAVRECADKELFSNDEARSLLVETPSA